MSSSSPYAPPGETADATPRVLTWFRVYAASVALLYGSATVLVALLPTLATGSSIPPRIPLAVLFATLAALHVVAACAPRKPWGWTLAFIVLAFGLSSCTLVFAIPLLLAWRAPLVRAAFRRV